MADELDEARVPWVVTWICAGLYAAPTMLTLAPALVDERIAAATGWSPAALTASASLMFAAAAPGAVGGSTLADRFGRKPLTLLMTGGTGACLVAMAAAPATELGGLFFCAARVLGGFCQGGVAPTVWTWEMELTRPGARVRAGMWINVMWVGGPLFLAALHAICLARDASWRAEALILCLFPLCFAGLARAAVPESPEFLAARGVFSADDAENEREAILEAGGGDFGSPGPPDGDAAAADKADNIDKERAPASPLGAIWADPTLRTNVVRLCAIWGAVSMSYYGLNFCAGSLSDRVVVNFALLNLVDMPGYVAAGSATKRWRRPVAVTVAFAAAAAAALVGLALGGPPLLGVFGKFCTAALFQQVYTITTDKFDTDVRATAFGCCRVAAMLATLASPPLATLPLAASGAVFAAACLLIALVVPTLH